MPAAVLFRDKLGRFMKQSERYGKNLAMVQRRLHDRYVTVKRGRVEPMELASLLNRRQFEALAEASREIRTYKSRRKYAAWDIAEQIDKTPRVRHRILKITLDLVDGKRMRKVTIYHTIKTKKASNISIWKHINQAVGLEGMQLYSQVGGKILSDRVGRKVSLKSVKLEEII
jgi:hypothetical protein